MPQGRAAAVSRGSPAVVYGKNGAVDVAGVVRESAVALPILLVAPVIRATVPSKLTVI
jgi:hypothetical protein